MLSWPRTLCALALAVCAFGAPLGAQGPHVSIKASFDPPVARAGEVVDLVVEVAVEPGWHVYGTLEENGEPTSLEVAKDGGLVAKGAPRIPPGERHEVFGMVSHWILGGFEIRQRYEVSAGMQPGELAVEGVVHALPCTEEICDPPEKPRFSAALTVEAGEARAATAPTAAEGGGTSDGAQADEDYGGVATSLWGFLAMAVLWGLITLLMPCTYPMIPITISFFTKQASDRGGRVLPLSLAYGAGIVLIFVFIGVVIGGPIVGFAQHPITNLLIGALFVVFAFSLFGWFELRPPRFLMNAATKASTKGGFAGVFLMGATLVVTSFTCTAPFVGSLLGVGAKHGELWVIALGMGVFGLTMALPFVALSLVPGKIQAMPRSGEWMNTIKVTLGFVELAAALKFLSNAEYTWQLYILPRELFLLFWTLIFAGAGFYLLGFFLVKREAPPAVGPKRALTGLLVLTIAGYCSYGTIGHELDRIMTAIVPPYRVGKALATHEIVVDDYDAALARAREKDKLLLVNFTGFS